MIRKNTEKFFCVFCMWTFIYVCGIIKKKIQINIAGSDKSILDEIMFVSEYCEVNYNAEFNTKGKIEFKYIYSLQDIKNK